MQALPAVLRKPFVGPAHVASGLMGAVLCLGWVLKSSAARLSPTHPGAPGSRVELSPGRCPLSREHHSVFVSQVANHTWSMLSHECSITPGPTGCKREPGHAPARRRAPHGRAGCPREETMAAGHVIHTPRTGSCPGHWACSLLLTSRGKSTGHTGQLTR